MARRRGRRGRGAAADPVDAEPLTGLQRQARRLDRAAAKRAKLERANEPTPEQQRRNRYVDRSVQVEYGEHPAVVRVNVTADAVDRYLARNYISAPHHAAARKYRDDYERCGFERPITGRYEGGGGSGASTPNMTGMMAATHAQIDARDRFRAARAVLPTTLRGGFDRMVLHDDDARLVGEAGGKIGQQAARFAVEWLRICCAELAAFYRIGG